MLEQSSHRPLRMLACEKPAERWDVMDITRRIALVAVTALALGGGAGAATAFASSHSPARAQQVSTRAGATHNAKGGAGEDSSSEGNNESDGPGGHADPPGNVEHEFNGVE